jgi:hypothetical protein
MNRKLNTFQRYDSQLQNQQHLKDRRVNRYRRHYKEHYNQNFVFNNQ